MDNFNHSFFTTPSPELAYFLGLFAADGCVSPRKGYAGYSMKIKLQSRDQEILHDIKRWAGIKAAVLQYTENLKGKSYPCSVLVFRSKWLGEVLIALGIGPRKSETLGEVLFPSQYTREFVRGFIDGDGCWARQGLKYPQLVIQGPHPFLVWFAKVINAGCGAVHTGIYNDVGSLHRLVYARRPDYLKVRNWLDGTCGMARKSPALASKIGGTK